MMTFLAVLVIVAVVVFLAGGIVAVLGWLLWLGVVLAIIAALVGTGRVIEQRQERQERFHP